MFVLTLVLLWYWLWYVCVCVFNLNQRQFHSKPTLEPQNKNKDRTFARTLTWTQTQMIIFSTFSEKGAPSLVPPLFLFLFFPVHPVLRVRVCGVCRLDVRLPPSTPNSPSLTLSLSLSPSFSLECGLKESRDVFLNLCSGAFHMSTLFLMHTHKIALM